MIGKNSIEEKAMRYGIGINTFARERAFKILIYFLSPMLTCLLLSIGLGILAIALLLLTLPYLYIISPFLR